MKTAGIEFIRNEMGYDKHEPYVSVRMAQFDLAETWYLATGHKMPTFEPSPLLDANDIEEGSRAERLFGAMRDGLITEKDMDYWWYVLDRMEVLLILSWRAY
jgi:hypothetical protein